MAARVLLNLSRPRRLVQHTIPRFCDEFTCQALLWSHFSACSDAFSHFRPLGGLFNRFSTRTRPSSLSSISTIVSEVECRSSGWQELASSPVGQKILYSSSALAIEDEETVRLAAEIGYKVLGQYVSDSPQIMHQAAFAVVQVGSHQFKVTPGDMIYTEKLKHVDVNDKVLLNKVLLLGSSKHTVIGRPHIPEAGVVAAVEEIVRQRSVSVGA